MKTINRERFNIELLLNDNPGLKPKREATFAKAYGIARREAASEAGLPRDYFPIDPPFTFSQAETLDFWPA